MHCTCISSCPNFLNLVKTDPKIYAFSIILNGKPLMLLSFTDSVSDNGPDPEIQKILEEAKDTDLNLNIDSPLSYQYVENKRIINR